MTDNQNPAATTATGKVSVKSTANFTQHMRRGPKKPPLPAASKMLGACTALLIIAVSIGIIFHDMRTVIASIYFALGFVVQRASFCSASLISAVVLSRDMRGLVAIMVAVLVAMLGFGIMSGIGLISVYPGLVGFVPALVGGLLFGVGMVFAGGCVSGSLFKATEGRWPSILAVAGIFAGMTVGITPWGRNVIAGLAEIKLPFNPPPNLAATNGPSYAHLMTGIALIGLAGLSLVYRRRILAFRPRGAFPAGGPWPLFGVALIIGLLGWAAFRAGPSLGFDFPLGASHIPSSLINLVLFGNIRIVGLLAWFFVLGSALSAWLRGEIQWRSAPGETLLLAFIGGILVGLGAIVARGCFVGHILSGWALLSTHALIFGVVMILANWTTTLFYLRGWRS